MMKTCTEINFIMLSSISSALYIRKKYINFVQIRGCLRGFGFQNKTGAAAGNSNVFKNVGEKIFQIKKIIAKY